MAAPIDDISTIQPSTSRPNHGAVRGVAIINKIAFFGVLLFGSIFSEPGRQGFLSGHGIEQPAGSHIETDDTRKHGADQRDTQKNEACFAHDELHRFTRRPIVTFRQEPFPWHHRRCYGIDGDIYESTEKDGKDHNTVGFLGEKSNSSAACGMESKPTKAHGAMATTATIDAQEDLSSG